MSSDLMLNSTKKIEINTSIQLNSNYMYYKRVQKIGPQETPELSQILTMIYKYTQGKLQGESSSWLLVTRVYK